MSKNRYSQETLMEIFRIGAKGKFEYTANSFRNAYRLRQMLYYYRKKLRQENHPFYLTANTVSIRISANRLIANPIGYDIDLEKAVKKQRKGIRSNELRKKQRSI